MDHALQDMWVLDINSGLWSEVLNSTHTLYHSTEQIEYCSLHKSQVLCAYILYRSTEQIEYCSLPLYTRAKYSVHVASSPGSLSSLAFDLTLT